MTVPEPTAVTDEHSQRTITVQGIATHLHEGGVPTAPPLLYLHGTFLGNLWLDYHKALARDFHIFAPDTPGFGLTPRPDWMRDMSDYILYFRDLLDLLGLEKPLMVGHSLGGWMAMELAVWYPERVSKLVLSNAAGIRVKGSPIADLFAMNQLEILQTCFDDLNAALPLRPPTMDADYYLAMYRQATTLAALAWNPSYDPKLERRLAGIIAPTLVVWGANDRLIPPIYGKTLQRLIPNAQLVTLEGTGHMPMFEQQEKWNAAIRAFLQDGEAHA